MLFGYRVGNTTLWGIGIVAILALIAGGMMLKKSRGVSLENPDPDLRRLLPV